MSSERCENCRFWLRDVHQAYTFEGAVPEGVCRRLPPVEHPGQQVIARKDRIGEAYEAWRPGHTGWPAVSANEWCGEWQEAAAE